MAAVVYSTYLLARSECKEQKKKGARYLICLYAAVKRFP